MRRKLHQNNLVFIGWIRSKKFWLNNSRIELIFFIQMSLDHLNNSRESVQYEIGHQEGSNLESYRLKHQFHEQQDVRQGETYKSS